MLFREAQHRLVKRTISVRLLLIEESKNRRTHRALRSVDTDIQSSQMGKAERTRISQRMSQHRMQLKLSLRITASEALISYHFNMFIAQRKTLVNPFSAKTIAVVLAAALSRSPHARPFRLRWVCLQSEEIPCRVCGRGFPQTAEKGTARRQAVIVPAATMSLTGCPLRVPLKWNTTLMGAGPW